MTRLAAILLAILASCTPRAIVVNPIAPRAVVVAETAKATSRQAVKVEKAVAKVSNESNKLNQEIIKGMLAADALRKAGLATQEQLDANYDQWSKTHARNFFLEAANQSATIDARELREAAERGRVEAEALVPEAVKTDANTAAIVVENKSLGKDAAFGKKFKWGIGTVLVLVVAYLILRFLWPLAKKLINPAL